MSARPETLALLDRMFGPSRELDDQLVRIETAQMDYRSIVEHLAAVAREYLEADQDDSDAVASLAVELGETIKWAEREASTQSETILDANGVITVLVGLS